MFLLQLDGLGEITKIYWVTEQKCRKFTRIMAYIFICNVSSIVMALNYAIYCICVGNMDTSTWKLPFKLVVAFDTKPLWGWFLQWLFQFGASISYNLCISIPTAYFAAFCRYIEAICKHFEQSVDAIGLDVENIRSETKDRPPRPKNANDWNHVRGKLFRLIDHHVNALE